MQTRVLVFFCLLATQLLAKHVDLPAPYEDDCIIDHGTNLYDPKNADKVPWFEIDLDAPASERFVEIATIYKDRINDLIQVVKDLVLPIHPDAVQVIDFFFGELHQRIDQPYKDEISSISDASGIPLGQIVMYNIIYEAIEGQGPPGAAPSRPGRSLFRGEWAWTVLSGCTSLVAVDEQGKLFHARNLDFGIWLGWDPVEHEWELTRALRKMIVNIRWIKGGKLLYKSNNFAGYVGIYNGVKPGAFAITANSRSQVDGKGGHYGIMKWLTGEMSNGRWMTWLARETLETMNNYAEAKEHLMNTEMLSPVYYILSGTKPDEACIISRSFEKTDILTEIVSRKDPWFILQTNYDPDTDTLFVDDRQTPGDNCMRKLGRKNVGFDGIYNVLSSRSNLNKLTTYTALMHTDTGDFETHLQSCPGVCWGW